MILNEQQIRAMTKGAVRIREENGTYKFMRFTEAEEKVYAEHPRAAEFFSKTFKPAGVRFAVRTDSDYIAFDVSCGKECVAAGDFDIYENGTMIKHISVPYSYIPKAHVRVGLSEGEKLVEVYFPYNARAEISNVELADGASFEPASRRDKMLAYGDSITHGSTSTIPSLSYANSVARALDADIVNKGIGGEQFYPLLLCDTAEETPDFITVAYGTNDWSHRTQEEFDENCGAFFQKLAELYPNTPIFAITPTWRADYKKVTPYGAPTTEIDGAIRRLTAPYQNITVIDGWDLVPQKKTEFFADGRLHPNAFGFAIYTLNLYRKLLPHLIEKIGYTFA